jgi:hypothetical protein
MGGMTRGYIAEATWNKCVQRVRCLERKAFADVDCVRFLAVLRKYFIRRSP